MEDKIFIGSDHGGFALKNRLGKFLKAQGYDVVDVGPESYDKDDDYPDYAEKVCKDVITSNGKGILICSSGQGMVRTASKFPGIYPSLCWSAEAAKLDREHSNPNVLCMSAVFTTEQEAEKIATTWLSTPFSGRDRSLRRHGKIQEIEKKNFKQA